MIPHLTEHSIELLRRERLVNKLCLHILGKRSESWMTENCRLLHRHIGQVIRP
jgi:hypothetical protein